MTSGALFGLTSRSCANGFVRTAALFRSGRAIKPVHGLEIGAGEKSRTQPRAALTLRRCIRSLPLPIAVPPRGQDGQNETEQPDHSASLGDSITLSTQIRFSVHTRMPPKTSSMYPSSISRALCSDGMRCIKPLAPSRNETNSSRVNGGAVGAILGICSHGGRDQAEFVATIKLVQSPVLRAWHFGKSADRA